MSLWLAEDGGLIIEDGVAIDCENCPCESSSSSSSSRSSGIGDVIICGDCPIPITLHVSVYCDAGFGNNLVFTTPLDYIGSNQWRGTKTGVFGTGTWTITVTIACSGGYGIAVAGSYVNGSESGNCGVFGADDFDTDCRTIPIVWPLGQCEHVLFCFGGYLTMVVTE